MAAVDDQKQFTLQKVIASKMLPSFPVGPEAARIGLLLYGSRSRKIVSDLNDHDSIDGVKSKLISLQNLATNDYVTFDSITSSLKASAREAVRVLSTPSSGARSGAAKRVVLFAPSSMYIPTETLFEPLVERNIQVTMMKLAPFSSSPSENNPDDGDEKKGLKVKDTQMTSTPTEGPPTAVVIYVTPIGSTIDVEDDLQGNGLNDIIDAVKPGILYQFI